MFLSCITVCKPRREEGERALSFVPGRAGWGAFVWVFYKEKTLRVRIGGRGGRTPARLKKGKAKNTKKQA